MSTQLEAQTKALAISTPSFTPTRTFLLQRKCACGGTPGVDGECAECRSKRLALERRSPSQTGLSTVPPIVHNVLRSPGQPLESGTRAFMEPRLGRDFSQVRVHTDAQAAESAQAVNALAYTVGRDVVFGGGEYAPGTSEGRKLLAHELMHVVQQEGNAYQRKSVVSQTTDASEQEADHVAQAVVQSPLRMNFQKSRFATPESILLRYRSRREQYFGRENDPASGLIEQEFTDPENQPWIEHISVKFDGTDLDHNPALAPIPESNRLMATGNLTATYKNNKTKLPDFSTPVGGGSTVLGLTDQGGPWHVHRIEGVGYNAAALPGEDVSTRIPGTKYTRDPHPETRVFTGNANMHYAVFFNPLQKLEALHIGPLNVGSHACVHVPNPPMKKINYHSRTGEHGTKVSVSYTSALARTRLCDARFRLTGLRRNPC